MSFDQTPEELEAIALKFAERPAVEFPKQFVDDQEKVSSSRDLASAWLRFLVSGVCPLQLELSNRQESTIHSPESP